MSGCLNDILADMQGIANLEKGNELLHNSHGICACEHIHQLWWHTSGHIACNQIVRCQPRLTPALTQTAIVADDLNHKHLQ